MFKHVEKIRFIHHHDTLNDLNDLKTYWIHCIYMLLLFMFCLKGLRSQGGFFHVVDGTGKLPGSWGATFSSFQFDPQRRWLTASSWEPDVRCEVEQGMQGTLAERPAKLRLSGLRDWLDLCWILISVEYFPHKQLRGGFWRKKLPAPIEFLDMWDFFISEFISFHFSYLLLQWVVSSGAAWMQATCVELADSNSRRMNVIIGHALDRASKTATLQHRFKFWSCNAIFEHYFKFSSLKKTGRNFQPAGNTILWYVKVELGSKSVHGVLLVVPWKNSSVWSCS